MTIPRVTAIVLAAGRSSRMGDRNKLLAEIDGRALLAHSVDAALRSRASPVIVVTGHQADAVVAALPTSPIASRSPWVVHNPAFADGLSTSLKAGLAATPSGADGALILLADMPWITASIIDTLIAAFDPGSGHDIVVPMRQSRRGNPVLWGQAHFDALRKVVGDTGARHVLLERRARVRVVDIDSEAIFLDIDTPHALADARAGT